MKEYVRTLIYISVFSIVLEIILPNTKLKKHISTMISILVVLVTISPVVKYIKQEDVLYTLSKAYSNIDITLENNKYISDIDVYSKEQIRLNTKTPKEWTE